MVVLIAQRTTLGEKNASRPAWRHHPSWVSMRLQLAGCLDGRMTTEQEAPRVVSASREIAAGPGRIFELIADPARQPRWDGNDNLAEGS